MAALAVDVGIAPLIQWLWEHGFETTASCENFGRTTDHKAGCYVHFADKPQAERFAAMFDGVIRAALMYVPDDLDIGDSWYPPGSCAVIFPPGVLASRILSVARRAAPSLTSGVFGVGTILLDKAPQRVALEAVDEGLIYARGMAPAPLVIKRPRPTGLGICTRLQTTYDASSSSSPGSRSPAAGSA